MKRAIILAAGLLLILVLTLLAFGLPVGPSLQMLAKGAFDGEVGWGRTLARTTPLIFTGLAMVVAWRAGMYNIGGEGQYIFGGIFGATVAAVGQSLPPALLMILILVSTVVGGALYSSLAIWLYISRGVQIVISTILLNFIAIQLLSFLVRGPLKAPGKFQLSQTLRLDDAVMLMRFSNKSDLHVGFFLSILAGLALWLYLFRSEGGLQIRIVGENARAARAAGMNVAKIQWRAMAISGGLCGLAGGVEYLGISGAIDAGFAQQWGFYGIPVALLAGIHPAGVFGSGLYFGALFSGTQYMSRFGSGDQTLIFVIQGVAVLGHVLLNYYAKRKEVERV